MHNARIRWLTVFWLFLPWLVLAQPPPALVRSVLTTNLPAFGSAGQVLTRQAGIPYLVWLPPSGDLVLSNYVTAISNLLWQSDNMVSNWVNSVSNQVNGGAFIKSASGIGTNTQIYGSSGGTNWWLMTTNGPVMTNTAGSFTMIRNGQITTSSNVNASHFSISNTPVVRIMGTGNDFFGDYTATNWTDQFAGLANLCVGYRAGASLFSNVNSSIFIGYNAGVSVTNASFNTIVGVSAGTVLQNQGNCIIGHHAGANCTNLADSMLMGEATAEYATNGTQLTLIGSRVGSTNNGTGTTAIGYNAGKSLMAADYNTFIGWGSGFHDKTGGNNVAIGTDAGHTATAAYNTFLGTAAGYYTGPGQYNVFVGARAGWPNVQGNDNIWMGFQSGMNADASNICNTFIVGGPDHGITNVFFGEGIARSNALSYTINGTAGTGLDTAGAHLSLAGGKSTGTRPGGSIRFFVSPAGAASGTSTNDLRQVGEFNTNTSFRVNPGGGLNPVGSYGALMMNSTNIVAIPGAAGVYTNISGTNFTSIVTNGFFGNIVNPAAALTNLYAGWYRVTISLSALGQNNQAIECDVVTNGVACDLVSFKKTFDAAARLDAFSATGIIYLPALCGTQFMVQDGGAGGTLFVQRANLVIGTP